MTRTVKTSSAESVETYLFIGFRDESLVKKIVDQGGRVSSSMTKAVTVVVCKTGEETSKNMKIAVERSLRKILKSELEAQLQPPEPRKRGRRQTEEDEMDRPTKKGKKVKCSPEVSNSKRLVYCFTGFRDASLEEKIKESGGDVAKSMTKAVNILVCDSDAVSAKVQTAKNRGVKVVKRRYLEQQLKRGSSVKPNEQVLPDKGSVGDTRFFSPSFIAKFFTPTEYARKEYTCPPSDEAAVRSVESQLGYKLPDSYVELMKGTNGGKPSKTCIKVKGRDIYMSYMFGIGKQKNYSLCGKRGSKFWIQEWKYPKLGIYFADAPSGGHEMFALDYRKCGKKGEPEVVHIDQECDYRITRLAPNFQVFVESLVKGDY